MFGRDLSRSPFRFYFPGVLVGPYLVFSDYMNLIDGTLYNIIAKEDGAKRAAVTIPGRLVPRGRKRVAYRKMLTGLVFLGLFVSFAGEWNFSVTMQDWFSKKSLLYR